MNTTLSIKKCTDSFTTIGFWTQKLSLSLLTLGLLAIPTATTAQISNYNEIKKTEIVSTKVENDNITLRVKVTGEGNKPITDLNKEDFKLRLKDIENSQIIEPKVTDNRSESDIPFDWISAQETTPPPVYIIFLLDASGSMNCPNNLKTIAAKCDKTHQGERKWDAAVTAIEKTIKTAKSRGGNTQASIIPFGYTAPDATASCSVNTPVNLEDLSKRFYNVSDVKHSSYLEALKKKPNSEICQSTNIYDSLIKSVNFFKNPPTVELKNSFYPVDKEKKSLEPKPRLSIFLLTDGMDTQSETKIEQENKLNEIKNLIGNNSQISIHALGYGLTPEELRQKYYNKTIPKEEKLDIEAIDKIGKITQGIGMTANKPDEVAEKLNLFLNAVLGEYEIKYIQPKAVRGRAYNISISAQGTKSPSQEYRILNFGRIAPENVLWGTLVLSGLLGAIWWFSHCYWRQKLLEES
jgi:hypothetical protein